MVSAAARIPAFLVPVLIAAFFGAGGSTDAYFIAYSAALLVGGTIAQGIEQAIVPFAAQELSYNRTTAGAYFQQSRTRASALALGLWCIASIVVTLVAPLTMRKQIAVFLVCLTPLATLWAQAAVLGGALVSQWAIAPATGSMLWRGVGALMGFGAVSVGAGLWAVPLGLGLGEGMRVWWLRLVVNRRLPPQSPGQHPSISPLMHAVGAQIVASAAIGAAPLIERVLALRLGAGAASYLEYAVRLLVIPTVLFDGALAPLLLAKWSLVAATNGPMPAKRDVFRATGKGLAAALVCALVVFVFGPFIVEVVLLRGRFSHTDAAAVADLLRLFTLGFVATMGALLVERFYIATRRNQLLAWLSVARAAVRIATAYSLLARLGLKAFAVGCIVADWTYLMVLLVMLHQSLRYEMSTEGAIK